MCEPDLIQIYRREDDEPGPPGAVVMCIDVDGEPEECELGDVTLAGICQLIVAFYGFGAHDEPLPFDQAEEL